MKFTINEGFNIVKNHQRKVNKLVKNINKILMDDSLFLGRFHIKQINKILFNDQGYRGIIYFFEITYIGHPELTKIIHLDRYDTYSEFNGTVSTELYKAVNDYIVKDSGFWERKIKYAKNNKNNTTNTNRSLYK